MLHLPHPYPITNTMNEVPFLPVRSLMMQIWRISITIFTFATRDLKYQYASFFACNVSNSLSSLALLSYLAALTASLCVAWRISQLFWFSFSSHRNSSYSKTLNLSQHPLISPKFHPPPQHSRSPPNLLTTYPHQGANMFQIETHYLALVSSSSHQPPST